MMEIHSISMDIPRIFHVYVVGHHTLHGIYQVYIPGMLVYRDLKSGFLTRMVRVYFIHQAEYALEVCMADLESDSS